MKTSLILHGHFYQPPRENPKTGLISNQASAFPFKNWNQRILKECYSANAYSRYLDSNGAILSITNNYEHLSYNFGPTLLKWIKKEDILTYEKIIQADKESIKRLGFGNAIAQCFNHTILPLADKEDIKLQVNWGIEDFIYNFNRTPQGIWLAETAINNTTIDILAQNGINFVILSPWQVKSINNETKIPYDRPFKLQTENSEISAFFYHPGLAESISFGHALRDADKLYNTLLEIKEHDNASLIQSATDGEIYGHHEAFGDMALAALIKKVNNNDDFVFTNYAYELNKNKAVDIAILKEGDDKKGTSWSCSHGVSRWYKDCGCHTGGQIGWNQKWRTPLRNSLNKLRDDAKIIFENEINSIFKNQIKSYDLLLKSSPIYSNIISYKDYIKTLHDKYTFSQDNDTKLAKLLNAMINIQYSFTSCGFFFADLDGIEAKQNINYALNAINILCKYSDKNLLSEFKENIKSAESNNNKTGLSIVNEEMKKLDGLLESSLYFLIKEKFYSYNVIDDNYGYYILKVFNKIDNEISMTIYNKITLETNNLNISEGKENLTFTGDKEITIQYSDIPQDIKDEIGPWFNSSLQVVSKKQIADFSNRINDHILYCKDASFDNSLTLELLVHCIEYIKYIFASIETNNFDEDLKKSILLLLDFITKHGRPSEKEMINLSLNLVINNIIKIINREGLSDFIIDLLSFLLKRFRSYKYELDLTKLQNTFYKFYNTKDEKLIKLLKDLNFKQ